MSRWESWALWLSWRTSGSTYSLQAGVLVEASSTPRDVEIHLHV